MRDGVTVSVVQVLALGAWGTLAMVLTLMPQPTAAWVASPVAASPGPSPVAVATPTLEGAIAWPSPPTEGCMSPALSVVKVLAVVLGALAAIKIPLVLAKLMLAKVLLLVPLALPLLLPLLIPFMMIAAMSPLPGFGMDDGPDSSSPGGGGSSGPALPPSSGPAGGGNASPVTPSGEEIEGRAAWVESCVQRVACQLSSRGSKKECSRFRCAAIDWLGSH